MLDIPIHSFIDARSAERGKRYVREGRVIALEQQDAATWSGAVQGSDVEPYVAHIKLHTRGGAVTGMSTHCSCPLGHFCKHVAALLFSMMAQSERASPRRLSPAPPVAASAADWLQAADGTLRAPAWQMYDTERLAYRVGPQHEGQLVASLRLELGRLYGQKREFRPRDLGISMPHTGSHNPHALVQTLLRHMCDAYSLADSDGSRVLEHPQLCQLVRAMAYTRALFWADDDASALRWADGRSATLGWGATATGQLALRFDLPDTTYVLCGAEALYIDSVTREVGPLHHGLPEALLRHLITAPALPVAEAQAFRAALSDTMGSFIPPPTCVHQRKEKGTPQPELQLIPPDPKNHADLTMRAQVSFAYGEHRVASDAADKSFAYIDGDTMVTVQRNLRAENALIKQVRALGPSSEKSAPKAPLKLAPVSNMQEYGALLESLAPLQATNWSVREGPAAPPRLLDIAGPVEAAVQDGSEDDWFSLQLGVDVEGERHDLAPILVAALNRPEVGLAEIDAAPADARIYLPLDDNRLLAIPKERLTALLSVVQELLLQPKLGLGQAVALTHLLDTGDCKLLGDAFVLRLARRLRDCEGVVNQPLPTGLQATLRPYQQHGYNWLAFLREHHLGGILADDMGLGKTLQTLAHLLAVKERGLAVGPFLVVVPTSLLFNWHSEISRFTPALQVVTHHGPRRNVEDIHAADVVLTSYGTLARDIDALAPIHFDTVVLDESHAIKNPRAALHHAVRRLQSEHRLCLSGTPLQNNLEELWAQFAFLMPGFLDTHARFQEVFRRCIEKENNSLRRAQLAGRVRPFMMRRHKAEVAKELPPKTEIIERLELTGGQRDLYEIVRNLMDQRVQEALKQKGLARSSIVVLDALLKLRQVCCDPRLVKVAQAARVKTSVKLQRLVELVDELKREGRRILVFSQFTSMLDLISASLTKHRIEHLMLTGKSQNRAELVNAFQSGDVPVFLLSLKAGGVGLNLTAADTVVHYDPWWNPTAEMQATDRAHRIGQDKSVFVYKLIAAGSVEERILELQQRKLRLIQGVVDEGALSQTLTQEDLHQLFAPLQ